MIDVRQSAWLLSALLCALLLGCGSTPFAGEPGGFTPVLRGVETPVPTVTPGPGGDTPIRMVAANLTSGNKQSYDLGHGARILEGLEPDVVLIQEFNVGDNSQSELRAWVDEFFGPEFYVYREKAQGIPNGVISRWPIADSGVWDDPTMTNREHAWARIDLPGDADLWAVSVHLSAKYSEKRIAAAEALREAAHQWVPESDFLVVGGDFNTKNRGEACLSALSGVVDTSGPHPADQDGNGNTNASRSKPYDHVLVESDLATLQVPTELESTSHPWGLVVDTRVHEPMKELAPALLGDSGASSMQHMAVVKDFVLPAK